MNAPDKMLGKVLDSLHVGVVLIDKNQKILAFNRMAGEMLGQDPGPRVGTSLLLCHPERAEPGVMKMLNQMKSGELKQYQGWVNFMGRIMTEYIYPILDDTGKYMGAVAELHDGKEKAEYLKMRGEFKVPVMHGLGDSSPRSVKTPAK
jgi:PAS domain S-box-containing protein